MWLPWHINVADIYVLCCCCCWVCLLLQMGVGDGLPGEVTEELLQDDSFMQKFHHALLEVRTRTSSTPTLRRPPYSRQSSIHTISNQQQLLFASQQPSVTVSVHSASSVGGKQQLNLMSTGVCKWPGCCLCCVCVLQMCLQEGALICPETGRRFPVVNGIPNMLLAEDEV